MMSDSVDFREPKKKLYTEKDFYVSMTLGLCRMFVNKEKSHQRIWGQPPIGWDQDKLGPWRSPTGKDKDSLPALKKKCDFLIKHMPQEKKEETDKLQALITTVQKDSKLAQDIVFFLHFRDHINNFKDYMSKTENLKEIVSVLPLQEIQDSIKEVEKKIEMFQSSNKRSTNDDVFSPKEIKKPKRYMSKVSNKNAEKQNKSIPILPKLFAPVLCPLHIVQYFPESLSKSQPVNYSSSTSSDSIDKFPPFPSQNPNLYLNDQSCFNLNSNCSINLSSYSHTNSPSLQKFDDSSETESSHLQSRQEVHNDQIPSIDSGIDLNESPDAIEYQDKVDHQIPSNSALISDNFSDSDCINNFENSIQLPLQGSGSNFYNFIDNFQQISDYPKATNTPEVQTHSDPIMTNTSSIIDDFYAYELAAGCQF